MKRMFLYFVVILAETGEGVKKTGRKMDRYYF